MSWLQVHIHTDKQHVDALTTLLNTLEAQAVTYEDEGDTPIFEPALGTTPLWDRVKITGLFYGKTDDATLKKAIQSALNTANISAQLAFERLANQAWERAWMDSFHPMQFGQDLWICPSWTPPPVPNAVNLMMDPGLAFGSGTHPTTAMCLDWISLEHGRLIDKLVLDYGCGSGVLGIAASLFGAKHIMAVDIDPQALMATHNNSHRNHCRNIEVALPDQVPKGLRADVIIANILAGPLESLVDTFLAASHIETEILLSGLLRTQVTNLIHAYAGKFRLECVDTREEWALVHGYCSKNTF